MRKIRTNFNRHEWTEAEKQFIIDHNQEMSYSEMAANLGMTKNMVYKMHERIISKSIVQEKEYKPLIISHDRKFPESIKAKLGYYDNESLTISM